jgi:hypothetical protein
MAGRRPDYIVKLPADNFWHRLGVAWKNEGGTINIVLDAGVPITIPPGTKLVLTLPERSDEPS